MHHTALLWVLLCSPGAYFLPPWLWLVSLALGPLAFHLFVHFFSLRPAPAECVAPFRNIVIAHRGGQPSGPNASPPDAEKPPSFPENSLPAFRWACSDRCGGADAIELDVWLSRDGIPMVNHDPKLFRHFDCADDSKWIEDFTCAELQALKFLPYPHLPPKLNSVDNAYEKAEAAADRVEIHPDYVRTERMATLQEVVDMVRRESPHMKIMIEVKERKRVHDMCRALVDLFRTKGGDAQWMYSHAFIASFNPFVVYTMRQFDARVVTSFIFVPHELAHLIKNAADMRIRVPWWITYNLPLHWIVDDLIWWLGTDPRGLRFLGANLSACECKALTENQIRRDRAAGVVTSTWAVNNEQQKEWLLRLGCTVITDLQFGGGSTSASPRPQIVF